MGMTLSMAARAVSRAPTVSVHPAIPGSRMMDEFAMAGGGQSKAGID